MKTVITKEPNKQDLIFERTFDAPRDLVFQLYTDPKLMPDWWGPEHIKTEKIDMDVRTGGSWRVEQTDDKGQKISFYGVYHEVSKPARVIWTFEYSGAEGRPSLETVTFEEIDGRTKLKGHTVYQSVEDRDAMINSGMESGLNEGLDRFERLLDKKQDGQ
jgi:uncharacterized protein YndB with AHSA1/START domain